MSQLRHAHIRCTPWRAPCLALPGLWMLASAAMAQSSPWSLGLSTSFGHDSNLLRLADTQLPGVGESRSDTAQSTALVGSLDQALGRQRLSASLALRDHRFERNSKYDNQSYNGELGLNWSTVERVSGALTVSSARNLSTFNAEGIGLLPEKNLETRQAVSGNVSLGVVTPVSFELGAGRSRVRNSVQDPRVLARDFNQDTLSAGLTWRPSGALSLAAAVRDVRGLNPTFRTTSSGVEADRYKQQQVELVADWQASGASKLDLRLNFADTRYLANEARDFSSVNGSLNWLWQPSGKLRLTTRYGRDKVQDAYPATAPGFLQGFFVGAVPVTLNEQRVVSTLRVQATLDASAKLALVSSVQWVKRSLVRNTLPPATLDTAAPQFGQDTTTLWTLGGRWAPLRNALVGCDASSERRRARGELTSNLKGASLNCYGQINFQ